MSFTYPAASISVIKGNGFYRIKANSVAVVGNVLTSVGPGSLIPIDVGFNGIAVGPESDYEKYELLYIDPTAPGSIQVIPFSKDSPILGRVTSDNAEAYPGADGEKGKAFVRIADFGSFRGAQCITDLLIYTGAEPSQLPTKRSPKRKSANVNIVISGEGSSHYFPGYGRRIATIGAARNVSGTDVTMVTKGYVLGARKDFSTAAVTAGVAGREVDPTQALVEIELDSQVVTAANDWIYFQHNADTDGYFDFYGVTLTGTVASNIADATEFGYRGFLLSVEMRD